MEDFNYFNVLPKKDAFKKNSLGFPGGAVVKNPRASAGYTGSRRAHMPRSNYARAPQLLSLHSRAREPQLLKPMHHNY